ncbi:hypothetical protein Prudu_634S000100, partial [Prunus dulcis]
MHWMSNLIRRRRAVTTTQSSEPPAQPTSAATAPTLMDHLAVGPAGSQAPASSASSVAQPVSARRRHRPASTTTPHPLMRRAKKNTRGPCRQLKTAKVTRVTNSRINIGYDERHRAAPTAELHSSLAHDIGHVIRSHCPMKWKSWKVMPDETKTEVRGQLSTNYNLETWTTSRWRTSTDSSLRGTNSGRATCTTILRRLMIRKSLFRRVARRSLRGERINKAKVNKGNRKKKTLLHHSGSRPFSYRMDARRQGGPNSQRSTSLATFMFDLGMSWPRVRLPTSSRYSDRVCGSSTGCWVLDLDGDIGSDSREETGDILSKDGECQAEGTQTPFISAVKQSGHCFDSIGGHSSESDVGHSAVPRTVRHSSPAF